MPVADSVPFAHGHSGKLPLGRRVVIPGDNPTNALAPATGFVGTARDLARFFAQLDPAAQRERASGRQPARNDPPAMAQSCTPVSNATTG